MSKGWKEIAKTWERVALEWAEVALQATAALKKSNDLLEEQLGIRRFPDGTLKPFLDPHDYDQLRNDDKFLYNRGPKPEGLV